MVPSNTSAPRVAVDAQWDCQCTRSIRHVQGVERHSIALPALSKAPHDGGTVSNAGPQSLSSGVGRHARDKSQHPVLIGEHFTRNAWQGACVTAQGGRSHQGKTSAGTQDTAWSHVRMSE